MFSNFSFLKSLHASHKGRWYNIPHTQSSRFEILKTDKKQKEIEILFELLKTGKSSTQQAYPGIANMFFIEQNVKT